MSYVQQMGDVSYLWIGPPGFPFVRLRDAAHIAAEADAELAALRQRAEKAEALIEEIHKAMGGYPDSDLVSLATTLKVRDGVAEKAEARVGELEAERAALLRLLKTECFCEAGGVLGRTAGKPFVCGVCRRIQEAMERRDSNDR